MRRHQKIREKKKRKKKYLLSFGIATSLARAFKKKNLMGWTKTGSAPPSESSETVQFLLITANLLFLILFSKLWTTLLILILLPLSSYCIQIQYPFWVTSLQIHTYPFCFLSVKFFFVHRLRIGGDGFLFFSHKINGFYLVFLSSSVFVILFLELGSGFIWFSFYISVIWRFEPSFIGGDRFWILYSPVWYLGSSF